MGTIAPMTMRASEFMAQLLFVVSALLLVARAQGHSCATSGSRAAVWSCIQKQHLSKLGPLLAGLSSRSLRSSLTLQAARSYLNTQQHSIADELLLWTSTTAASLIPRGSMAHASTGRQLQQLSGTLQQTTLSGTQLTGSTLTNTRFTDPQGTVQYVSNDVSTFMTPLDQGLFDRLASFALGPDAPTNGLLSDFPGIGLDTTEAGAAGDTAQLGPDGAPAVAALDGQQQQQQQRLQPSLRIIGGVEAPPDRKYVCSLRTTTSSTKDFLYCGCSLIAPTVVMTAAHCLANADLRTPWVEIGRYYQQAPNNTGINDYDRIKCTAGVPNRSWSESVAQNDIALCFLDSPSRFTPVKVADAADTKLTSGQKLTVMGWGATSEGGSQASALMMVDVATTSLDTCSAAYTNNDINGETQICAGVPEGGKDACQGDSGGPLIIKGNSAADDVQVGIVSFGIGCGRPNVPGVYTDVRAYRQWIAQQLLARMISYSPLTAGFKLTSDGVDQTDACACTSDGTSGSTFLGSKLSGCKQHSLNMGDTTFYCYTKRGSDCNAATPSNTYPGAAWLECTPQVAKTDGSTAAAPAAVPAAAPAATPAAAPAAAAPAAGHQGSWQQTNLATTPSSTLLANWLGQWVGAAIAGKAAPHIALPDAAGSSSNDVSGNRTAGVVQGADAISRRMAQPAGVLG